MTVYLSNDEFLTYQELASGKYDIKERRALYSRLRSTANKRLKRMKGTLWAQTQTYQKNKDLYKPLSEIKTESELNSRLAKLTRFISAEAGSIAGMKRIRSKTLATMAEHGFTGVTESNWFDFIDYMEEMKAAYESELYVSDTWVQKFKEIEDLRKELSVENNRDYTFKEVQENFEQFLEARKK